MKFALACLMVFLVSCESIKIENKIESKVYDYNAKEFIEKLKESNHGQLVDIRTENEYKNGHIQNAILIDYYDKDFRKLLKSKLNKNYPVFIYCRSGNRSTNSKDIFKDLGFIEINNLKGGYNELLPFVEEC